MFTTTSEIRAANAAAGFHYFERSTMRFFLSRVLPGVHGGRYFITSEQFEDSHHNRGPRRFAIREACEDGDVDTVSPALTYGTANDARAAIRSILEWLPKYPAWRYGRAQPEFERTRPYTFDLRVKATGPHEVASMLRYLMEALAGGVFDHQSPGKFQNVHGDGGDVTGTARLSRKS